MKFKGTKGKWKFVFTEQHPTQENEFFSLVQMPKIAISICNTKFLSEKETKANALLISKAPEMLEMLKKSIKEIEHLKHEYRDKGHCVKYLMECEQLIKEATELKTE